MADGRSLLQNITVLDPDAIARTIQPISVGTSAIAAGREVLYQANEHLASGQSFAIETTLSGKLYLKMMSRARQLGYENTVIYIGTSSVDINLARIQQRVLVGGHDVPEDDVRRRYERSLRNLPIALRLADNAILFDNSQEMAIRAFGVLQGGVTFHVGDLKGLLTERDLRFVPSAGLTVAGPVEALRVDRLEPGQELEAQEAREREGDDALAVRGHVLPVHLQLGAVA